MGRCATAKLMYGYHLWNENEWAIEAVTDGKYGALQPATFPWLTAEQVADWESLYHGGELEELFEERLLAELAGFTETDWRVDGYHQRKREAEERVGVRFVHHGYEYQSVALAIGEPIEADWGDAKPINPVTLLSVADSLVLNRRLEAALATLALKPTQQRAQWLLTAHYG